MTKYLHTITQDDPDVAYVFSYKNPPQYEKSVYHECKVLRCVESNEVVPVLETAQVITSVFANRYNLETWVHPGNYRGYAPVGHFYIYSRNRDSCTLENVNYERILEDLQEKFPDHVYDYSSSHFACGWVDQILMRPDAPDEAQKFVSELLSALDDCGVYDEDEYSSRKLEEADRLWSRESLAAKADYCRDAGISLFASRREYWELPDNVKDLVEAQVA